MQKLHLLDTVHVVTAVDNDKIIPTKIFPMQAAKEVFVILLTWKTKQNVVTQHNDALLLLNIK